MIIDFHTHIFPAEIVENREKYFPGEGAFERLYRPNNSKMAGFHETLSTMDEQGVDKSVVFGFPWKNPETIKLHNDYVMEAVANHPDRLIGFCCLGPTLAGAVEEIDRCFKGGLTGVGELAFYESGIDDISLDRLQPVMEICSSYEAPVLIHTNEPVGHLYPGKSPITLGEIYTMIKRFPTNKIVLAHWGGGIFFYNLLKREVKESLKNVYFDTAASPFLYEPSVYKVAGEAIGIDKVLFGTDFPLLKPARYFKELEACGLSQNDIEKICGGNAAQLLRL